MRARLSQAAHDVVRERGRGTLADPAVLRSMLSDLVGAGARRSRADLDVLVALAGNDIVTFAGWDCRVIR